MKFSRHADIDAARADYLRRMDALAGQIRARHITDVAGQSATYDAKRLDAERYLEAADTSDPAMFPWVQAESEATGTTMLEAANSIATNRNNWVQAGVAIERERMRGKTNVRASMTVREMYEAFALAESTMEFISSQIPA